MHSSYAVMAAARYSSDVLQMFYGPIPREEKINLPEPLEPDFTALYDGFQISQNNFQAWLRVCKMDISKSNPKKKDLLKFARENKEKIAELVEQEAQRFTRAHIFFGQPKFRQPNCEPTLSAQMPGALPKNMKHLSKHFAIFSHLLSVFRQPPNF